ncbi:MAG: helix-turn-helix transcriptional regulator [Melioribacteraceae bacterium]|nr:helix-turn-helix transcriptional regulator [Melioribacteraceae bacterium]
MAKSKANKKEIIAGRLTIAREQAGLSQSQVAKLLNLHRPTISEIEAGRRNVSAEELLTFAKLYGVGLSWITDENEVGFDKNKDKIELAARELNKLKDDDLEKVIKLLSAIKGKPKE